MIVSTKKDGIGVLAEYTSTDLKTWEHAGVFMPMHWGADRFYECADVFKMGDWWYLVYSDQNAVSRKVCYFKGSTLDELKQMTAAPTFPDNKEGVLDSRAFYAGKRQATEPTVTFGAGVPPVPAMTIRLSALLLPNPSGRVIL